MDKLYTRVPEKVLVPILQNWVSEKVPKTKNPKCSVCRKVKTSVGYVKMEIKFEKHIDK